MQEIDNQLETRVGPRIVGEVKTQIDFWLTQYPVNRAQSAVMPALTILQNDNNGHLTTDLISELAKYLSMPESAVYEVATFYSMYEHKPVGKYKFCVCNSLSCMLRGSDNIVAYLEHKLGVNVGEVTQDGLFSIKKVECLGSCDGAPMMQLGNEYIHDLEPESLDTLIEKLSNK